MANGFQESREEWDRLEAPLLLIDPVLQSFADRHGINLSKNHKYPERSLEWGESIRCLIQIFIADKDGPTLNLWLCASQDRDGSRFWKNAFLLERVTAAELSADLDAQLLLARKTLLRWGPEELEFATTIDKAAPVT